MRVTVLVDSFPEASETFVVSEARALARLGHELRVEAGRAAEQRNPEAGDLSVAYMAGDPRASRASALAWLAARHPLRVLADLRERRRWAHEERVRPLHSLAPAVRRAARFGAEHLHAHFAAGAALDVLRVGRLLGLPYSVTAHGYDIYLEQRNLPEKLERAAFATSGCDYTVRDLRAIAPGAAIHKVIMGVDPAAFTREAPHPADRSVAAVGRLVEKKGFAYLVEAAALLRDRGRPLDRLTIAGDGPERANLESIVAARDLDGAVELPGALAPAGVRELLERADVLAMPCVVAADGDRDSMPVVVKEALAMEVPVVASDEVGLPELVEPAFGRLVPPRDPGALAGALDELLALPAERRAEMGRAGRAAVIECCSTDREAARLATLMAGAAAIGPGA